jgi:hypothetical protein
LALVLLGCVAILALSVLDAVRARARGAVPWKRFIPAGVFAVLVSIFATVNAIPRVTYRYETSVPWSNYTILIIVGLFTAAVLYFFLAWAGVAFAQRLYPAVGALADRGSRRKMIASGLLAIAVAPVWAAFLSELGIQLASWFPTVASPPPFPGFSNLETSLPALGVVTTVIPRAFLLCLIAASVARLFTSHDWPGRGLRIALLAAVVVGASLLPTRSTGEFLLYFVRYVLLVVVWIGLAVFLLRDNPLAYIGAAFGMASVESVALLIEQPNAWARGHGIIAALLLILPILWIGWDSLRARESTGHLDAVEP